MKRIVYSSAAVGSVDEQTLSDILAAARLRNARRDITGMLLYRDGVFLQLLEGSRVEVDLVMEAIRRDPRHRRLTLLLDERIEARAFPAWSMGYHALRGKDLGVGTLAVKTMDDIARDAPYALQLLLRFAAPASLTPTATTQKLRRAALSSAAD